MDTRESSDSPPALERLLESYGIGEIVSSDQSFTVSSESILQRYRTFQEQNESYYLLRLLQGLLRTGACEFQIKTTRTTIHIVVPHFSKSPPDWLSPSILVERLSQPHLWDRALHSICVGILCTRNESFEALQWSFGGRHLKVSACPSSDYRVLKGDPSTSKLKRSPFGSVVHRVQRRSAGKESRACGYPFTGVRHTEGSDDEVSRDGSGLRGPQNQKANALEILIKKKPVFIFSSTTQEHAELATRLGASRSPVVLDKLPLRLQKPEVKTGLENWYGDFTAPFHLAEVEAGLQKPEKWREWSDGFGTLSTPQSWAAFKWFCDPDGPYFRMLLSLSLEGKSVVFPVIDGVMSKSYEVATLPGITAYIDAQDLATDLSGLEVIDTSPLTDRISQCYDPLLERVREHSSKLQPSWDLTYPSYWLSENMDALPSPRSLLGFLSLTGVLMITEAASSRLLFSLRKRALRAKLRAALEERIDKTLRERRAEGEL